MNYKINAICFCYVSIAICIISSCTTHSITTYHDTTIVNYTIKQGPPIPANEWHCYNVDQEKICIPETWKFVNQTQFLFIADLSNFAPNSFFCIVKRSKNKVGFGSVEYLKELYTALQNDTTGTLNKSQAQKFVYTDKETFNCQFQTITGKKTYVTYSTIFEKDNYVFDIALKIDQDLIPSFGDNYNNIVFNFHHKEKPVFSASDKVKTIQIIDFKTLK